MTAAEIFVVHFHHSWPLAARLSMDLLSEGYETAPMTLEQFRAPDRDTRLAAATGLVIMYDWWLETPDFEVLHEFRKTRPVVFVRNRTQKIAPELMRFHFVSLFDHPTFSYYQPREGWGGYIELSEHFGVPRRPTDQRRRGFAFVSYVSTDRETVYEQVIPALADCRTDFFDYRYTERLKEQQLREEIGRNIRESRIVVAYASNTWRNLGNATITLEVELARSFARPIVAVTSGVEAPNIDRSMVRCVFGPDRDENARELASAMRKALEVSTGPA
jgi:hypothetical protein